MSNFTHNQNLELLWDVLLDELKINKTNKQLVNNIRMVFETNIKHFTLKVNPKLPIMELNKQFLSQVVMAVNKLFPKEQNIKRITISNEEIDEPYKIEDIQSARQSDFEKEFERKRVELETYMTPQKPKELNFSDSFTNDKIKSMDSLIAQKMAQRDLELSHINPQSNPDIAENWLKPKETSVKNEKYDNSSKKVSWNIQNDDTNNSTSFSHNIFDKLKKINDDTVNTNISEANGHNDSENQYVQQNSMPLPEVKQEEINRTKINNTIISGEPVIPKSEIVKQLNELNQKIDNLYDIVFKLTNELSKSKNNQLDTGIDTGIE